MDTTDTIVFMSSRWKQYAYWT